MNTITLSSAGQHWTVSPGFADVDVAVMQTVQPSCAPGNMSWQLSAYLYQEVVGNNMGLPMGV